MPSAEHIHFTFLGAVRSAGLTPHRRAATSGLCLSDLFVSSPYTCFQCVRRCHFGPCPPCPHACGQMLGCGHGCQVDQCHDAAPPDIPKFQQPAAPQQSALEKALDADRAQAVSAEVGSSTSTVPAKCKAMWWQ